MKIKSPASQPKLYDLNDLEDATLDWLDDLDTSVDGVGYRELFRDAVDLYNEIQEERAIRDRVFRKKLAFPISPDEAIRLVFNYIRHNLTDYEHYIEQINVGIVQKEVYPIVKQVFEDAIYEKYPEINEYLSWRFEQDCLDTENQSH